MCLNSVPFLLIEIVKVSISLFSQRMWSNSSVSEMMKDFLKVRMETHWNVTEIDCEMFSGWLHQ